MNPDQSIQPTRQRPSRDDRTPERLSEVTPEKTPERTPENQKVSPGHQRG